jgi:two-component system, NarL family, nitrate/nitrite response regulator NarL
MQPARVGSISWMLCTPEKQISKDEIFVMDSQDIRIALIHTNQLFRECLSYCLAQTDAITVVHSASALQQAGEQLTLYEPDILVVGFDLFQQEIDNFVGIWDLTSAIKTLVIEVPETENDVIYCIEKVGARGYVTRDASIKDLLNHIRAMMHGETFCSPRIANLVFRRMSDLAQRVNGSGSVNKGYLTKREKEVAILIEDGLSNKEIAVRLRIEVSTVKNHVHNLLDKLQLHDRHSAARDVRELGLISVLANAISSQSGS